MGLFKKKKASIVPTLDTELNKAIAKHDAIVDNYIRTKPALRKLVTKYKSSLTNYANIYDGRIRISLKKEFFKDYPDGFFAYADKLGLTIEPICNSYSESMERDLVVRAKSK